MKRIPTIAMVLFWLAVSASFLTPMELGDIWWHLKTGEQIWKSGSLPGADSFSIAFSQYSGSFVLKAFWLSEILLYLIQSHAGFVGLIVFKSAIFTSAFFLIYRILRGYGLRPFISNIAILPLVMVAASYDEIRPQSLTFLFFSLTLYLLETGRRDDGMPSRSIWLFPPLMLVWANMHGGYVIGVCFLMLYALRDLVAGRPGRKMMVAVAAASFALALCNPNGPQAFLVVTEMFRSAGNAEIHEHLPLLKFARMMSDMRLYYLILSMIAFGAATFLIPAVSKKRISLLYLLIFAVLSYAAIHTFRAGLFFAIAGTTVMGRNLSGFSFMRAERDGIFSGVSLALAAAALFVFFALPAGIFKKPALNEALIPVKATAFLEAERPPGNIFHPYTWGGYLIWRLYPQYRVFIDGRAMLPLVYKDYSGGKESLFTEYNAVLSAAPGWDVTLRKYGVNTVLFWPLPPYGGSVPPILIALLKDYGWSPIYWDLNCVIFSRSGLTRTVIPRDAVWELLKSLVMERIAQGSAVSMNYLSLGEIYMARGMNSQAREAFGRCLALDPGNRRAAYFLNSLDTVGQ